LEFTKNARVEVEQSNDRQVLFPGGRMWLVTSRESITDVRGSVELFGKKKGHSLGALS